MLRQLRKGSPSRHAKANEVKAAVGVATAEDAIAANAPNGVSSGPASRVKSVLNPLPQA
jgi:hypothetical protein